MGWFFFAAAVVLGILTLFFFAGVNRESSRRAKFAKAHQQDKLKGIDPESIDLQPTEPEAPCDRLLMIEELLLDRTFTKVGVYESPHRDATQIHLYRSEPLSAAGLIYVRNALNLAHYEILGECEDGKLLRLSINPLADSEPKRPDVRQYGLKQSPPDVATASFARRAEEFPLVPLPEDGLEKWVTERLRRVFA